MAFFGNKVVREDLKQALVDDVFHSVARRYDLMNDLMSGGLHRAWKDVLVTAVNPPRPKGRPGRLDDKTKQPFALLDLASGTGDVALRIADIGGPGTRITVADINPEMLAVGRERAAKAGRDIAFIEANAESLPLPDRAFDVVTIAFGIRNVVDRAAGLAEMVRVLKPGGRAVILEFSNPKSRFFKGLYHFYFRRVLPAIGGLLSKRSAYQYLPDSVLEFPDRQSFMAMMATAGFVDIVYHDLTCGIATVYVGTRP